jgi:glycosyltransferase involved in cell wall biosynthesis
MYHTRAGGHNILPFLEFFNENREHDFTFAYSLDRTYFPEDCHIQFEKISFGLFSIIRALKVIRSDYDLIWYHGGHSAIIFFLFTLFRSRKSRFVFNIWNEWLIHDASKGGIKGYLFRKAVKNSDVIQCNWHGTEKLVESTGWNTNIKTFYWGLQKDYFKQDEPKPTPFTINFLESLPKQKTKFFFPKSISPASRHDLIIEASKQLLDKGITDFIVYFWMGNVNNPELKAKLLAQIKNSGVEDFVVLQEHDFLPFSDIIHIWKHMDVGLQIAAHDQLSTTFVEPQFFQKEVIATDIEPYRIYNEKFDTKLELTSLSAVDIAKHMKGTLGTSEEKSEILNHRKKVIEEHFNFNKNIRKIVEYYA